MGELIQRKFEQPGDVELVRYSIILCLDLFNLLFYYAGPRLCFTFIRCPALAQAYVDKANEVLQELPESQAKVGLQMLTGWVMKRKS